MAKGLCDFGLSLVKPMCNKGISRSELAQLVGISPKLLDDYAYGRRKPSAKTRAKFEAVLGTGEEADA